MAFPTATYGAFLYGATYYGWVSGLPFSDPWDVFDFCEPNEAAMLSLFSFPETTAYRFGGAHGFYNVDSDYCMLSDDSLLTGFRIDTPVPHSTFSLQFSILPTLLPEDFSSLSDQRVFVSVFNQFGKTVGLLLSEDGGIALAANGAGPYTVFADSADLFSEGLDYYIFRVTVDEGANRANLYVTRKDVYAITGVMELRYTFVPLDTPAGETDNVRVEVYGTAANNVQICLDCIRLSSELVLGNQRPVAVIDDDQAVTLTQYAGFDGRGSYDTDTPPQPLSWWWTVTSAPDTSAMKLTGSGVTPADTTGYTNIVTGPAGTFSAVLEGDLILGDVGESIVMRVAADGSWIALNKDVMAASGTPQWLIISQSAWGGTRLTGTTMIDVLARLDTPPGAPVMGDKYLVIPIAVGAWAGREGEIATWNGISWDFEILAIGKMVFVEAELDAYRTAGGGVWALGDPKGWELDYWEGRTAPVGSLLGDVTSLYDVELIVNDGVRDSLPAQALMNVYETNVPLGLTPDLTFVWNYLSDFWDVVDGRDKVETFWSASAQMFTDELMKLWQHGYSKSLLDIQRTFQRRWLNFDPWYQEPNYDEDPATIENVVNSAGFATAPTPVGPDADPDRIYVLDTGDLPVGVTDAHYLVLEGVAYKITRTRDDSLITTDTLPTVDRPGYWMIRPTVTSRTSNFSSLGVTAGDLAVFEVRDEDGVLDDVTAHVWGARGSVLVFDDTNLSGQLASSTYTVRFKGVLRRSAIQVDDLIVSMPRLQEVIALDRVDGAPSPLFENLDFRVEEEVTVQSETVNTIQMTDSWFTEELRGFSGTTNAVDHDYFFDTTVDFEAAFGAGADLIDYVLELDDGNYYRLYQVISATQVELFDGALALNLTGQRWWIRQMDDPPDHLWSEVTYIDNRPVIDANFGRLISFTTDDLEERTDNLDYLSAVQGLWYYVWGPRTLFDTRIGSQIILGLPFAEVAGTVTNVQSPFDSTRDRILIQDSDNEAITRSYLYPSVVGIAINPETDSPYKLGDTVEQFAPLSQGVDVTDYEEDPDWFAIYVGSGDFYEVEKVHTWGVLIDSDIFDLSNLLFLSSYLRTYRPHYTDFFFAVLKAIDPTTVDVADPILFGPVVPDGYTYPDTWPAYEFPVTWASSPHEVPRAAVSSSSPVTVPAVPLNPGLVPMGNVFLRESPGSVPDGWDSADIAAGNLGTWGTTPLGPYQSSNHDPTISEGSMTYDETDQSGRYIHRFTDGFINLLGDPGFESTDDPDTGSSPWNEVDVGGMALAFSATNVASPVHSGSRSLHITAVGTHHGVEQPLDGVGNHPGPFTVDENFQVGVRLWIRLVSGQAYVRLLDQDNPQNVIAEWRHSTYQNIWRRITLHAWRSPLQNTNYYTVQILSGPAGGEFYVDDVAFYRYLMPWGQWGHDRAVRGRTGDYTFGGLPDDVCKMQIAIPVA
jgi:hypothetical protein